MPFGDGTGPRGMGPMTGRGAGYCTGFTQPGYINTIPARRWPSLSSNWRRNPDYRYSSAYSYPYFRPGQSPFSKGSRQYFRKSL